MDERTYDPKGGNSGGSRISQSSNDGPRACNTFPEDEPDRVEPSSSQKDGGEERGEEVLADDPHKVEKLAKAGRADFDTDAGAD